MSNYTKTTNFSTKDALPSGNPAKIVKGTEIDTEFNNIATAVATKSNSASPTFTGTLTAPVVTASTSLNIAGDGATVTGIKDEDDMASNSATKLATQQSIKAYVDSQVTAQDLDVTDGTTSISIDLDSEALSLLGGTGIDSTASGNSVTMAIDSTVATLTGTQALSNKTLTSPDVNTPDIDGGTIDGTVIGGTTAAAGSFTTVGATGNITVGGTVDGRDVATDGAKLDGIEAGADVTDTANVTAAGALMDSELTSIASVKALDQGVATTDSPTFAAATVTGEITASGGIALGDNDKATFGAGDDLQIYHDGSDSYVDDAGTGDLVLRGNNQVLIRDTGTNEVMGNFRSSGAVTLYYDNAEKISTTATGIDVTGNVALGDNGKAIFGAGSDLQIYHDGSSNSSYIKETGTGSFNIEATNLFLKREGGTESFIDCVTNGAVTAYYDGSAKLATTSTGIDVTGTATMDGLTVDDGGALIKDAGADAILTLQRTGSVTAGAKGAVGWKDSSGLYVSSIQTATNGADNKGSLFFRTSDDSTGNTSPYDPSKRMAISSNGDISFYEDTGTTPKFFWDASAESLGIGTSSPSQALHVSSASDTPALFESTDFNSRIEIKDTGGSSFVENRGGILNLKADSDNAAANSRIEFSVDNSERMRIDTSGNLLVGTTDTSLAANGAGGGEGVMVAPDHIQMARSGNAGLFINRMDSNGTIAEFRFNGTTVGSIGTTNSDLTIGTGDVGFRFRDGSNDILPFDVGSNSATDGVVSFGAASNRYNDVYLSGGVYLGGTGAANKLDDYEEGDATGITCTGSTSGSATVVINNAKYTKTGNVVNLYLYLTMDFSGDDIVGDIQIANLPFANANNNLQNVSIIHQTVSGTYLVLGGRVTSNMLRVQTNSTSTGLARADCVSSTNRVMMIGLTYNTNA